jgi:hypothetical protein
MQAVTRVVQLLDGDTADCATVPPERTERPAALPGKLEGKVTLTATEDTFSTDFDPT